MKTQPCSNKFENSERPQLDKEYKRWYKNNDIKDTTLYLSGSFTKIDSIKRHYAAAVSIKGNGVVTEWNPSLDNTIYSIIPSGDSLYLGGCFDKIKGASRPFLAKTDAKYGNPSSWKPEPSDPVSCMARIIKSYTLRVLSIPLPVKQKAVLLHLTLLTIRLHLLILKLSSLIFPDGYIL